MTMLFNDKTSILRNLVYAKFRFGSFGFVSVNLTKISVSVVSVFSCFGRPLSIGKYYIDIKQILS